MEQSQINKNMPVVSVVIATRNEEKNIDNCLASIKKQTYPSNFVEVIVVDNNSNDRTKEIASTYTNKVFNRGPERSAQRNYGMLEVATGKYVMYIDADMLLSTDLITSCVNKLESKEGIVALYIPEVVVGDSFWCRVRRFERSFYDGTVIDSVRFIRRDSFAGVKGFDSSMTGPEDWDLDKKLRNIGNVSLVHHPMYHNEADFSLTGYLKKKDYYAKSFETYVKKWGKDDVDIKKQLGFYYRFIGVFIEDGKWKKMLSNLFLTTGMYCLRIMVGLVFLSQRIKRKKKDK